MGRDGGGTETTGLDRRAFLGVGLAAVLSGAWGCSESTAPEEEPGADGRLATRWAPPTRSLQPGLHSLALGGARDGYIRVPERYDPELPTPFSVLLHGAGGLAQDWQGGFGLFDDLGMVVLAVESRGTSWDLRSGAFGPDVAFIDAALAHTFDRVRVDPGRLALAGFSDGASYALSLGLTNGDLFTDVVGFSPGFVQPGDPRGEPAVFLSHGTEDPVLPVSFTRELAGELRGDGYEVRYEEFEGGHWIPLAVADRAFREMVERG